MFSHIEIEQAEAEAPDLKPMPIVEMEVCIDLCAQSFKAGKPLSDGIISDLLKAKNNVRSSQFWSYVDDKYNRNFRSVLEHICNQ